MQSNDLTRRIFSAFMAFTFGAVSVTAIAMITLAPTQASASPLPGTLAPPPHPLTLAARVWGLAKYFHPSVTACALDWDQVLLDRIAGLDAAGSDPQRHALLADLLAAAGDTPRQAPDTATPRWIVESGLPEALVEQLAWLASQQPAQQCYVSPSFITHPLFDNDVGHATATPDRAHRALAAFRFWNAVEYFFPYKADIGRDWAWVLDEKLEAVLDGESQEGYVLAIRALTAAIEDSHAFLVHPPITPQSAGIPAFLVRPIEGRPVVTARHDDAGPVQPGDELLVVDGLTVEQDKASIRPLMFGSNPVDREALALMNVLSGPTDPGTFRFRRPDGSEYEAELARQFVAPPGPLDAHPVWHSREIDDCSFGIVDLTRLVDEQVDQALEDVSHNDALVFDMRGYPGFSVTRLQQRLYPQPTLFARFTKPRFDRPGSFRMTDDVRGGNAPLGYQGPILVLQDERAQSASEFTIMGLQATGRTIVFGSQTAGADGNITHVYLPGDIRATFSGIGVFYPDGRPTQRLGIVPDVHVSPTIEGLAAGRDEVLEAALDCRWLSERPGVRLPPTGLYFAHQRDGEGLDVHRDEATGAVLSYGYDDDGAPEWLLSAGLLSDADWDASFRQFAGIGEASSEADGFAVDFHAGAYTPACAQIDQSSLFPRGQWRWPAADGGSHQICARPLVLSGDGAATGLWAGPEQEQGWGVSVHQHEGAISVVAYAYDAQGRPRWLMGNAPWNGTGEVEIALQRASGFCRTCAPQPVQFEPAGTLRLQLDGGQSGNPDDNWLSIDAAFDPVVRWQRERMPLFRLVGASTL